MSKKILFIQENIFPKLGMMYIANVFRRHGWEINCLVSSHERHLKEKIKEINPQITVLSLTSAEYFSWGRARAQLAKEAVPNSMVMLGGAHATYMPEVIEDEWVDLVCIGEGEIPVSVFCERWENKKGLDDIPGFWSKKNGTIFRNEVSCLIEDLDTIAFPDRTLYQKYPFISRLSYSFVITTRGCPYRCTFCYNSSFLKLYEGKGKIVRRRSVDNVIAEITDLKKMFPWTKSICFADDLFWCDIPKGWLREFSTKYRERIGIPFSCTVFANWITEDTVGLLKEANCSEVKMGLETANQKVRQEILGKNITDAAIYRAAALLHKHKINFLTYNMLGIPTETYQDAFNTYKMNLKIKPFFGSCSLLHPYKGTVIADIAKEKGYLPPAFEFSASIYADTPLLIDQKDEIQRLQRFFPLGTFLRIPPKLVSWIIRHIRIRPLYDLIFTVSYGLLIGKMTKFTLQDMLILGLHSKAIKYLGFSRRRDA